MPLAVTLFRGGRWILCFAVLSVGHFLDRFFDFCSQKLQFFGFTVHCGLRIFRFLAFGFRFSLKTRPGFWIWYPMWFSVFLFWFRFLFDLSGNYAPPLISNERKTYICSTCHQCIGSIRVLITGKWKFISFDGFACGLRFWANFLAVWGFWMIFSTVLRFLMDPNAPLCLHSFSWSPFSARTLKRFWGTGYVAHLSYFRSSFIAMNWTLWSLLFKLL